MSALTRAGAVVQPAVHEFLEDPLFQLSKVLEVVSGQLKVRRPCLP